MYIIKNAFTSIVRNKGRNFLIGIIILVIACTISITLAINNSSNSLIESYKSKYEIEATLDVNRDNMMGNFNPEDRTSSREEMSEMFSSARKVSVEDIESYANSEYVKSYYYTMSVFVNSKELEKAEMSFGDNENDRRGEVQMPSGGGRNDFLGNNQDSGDFTLKGYSSIDAMQEFIEGSYTITSGEVSDDFEADNCLINSELATLNEVEVGDLITIVDSEDEEKTYELTVTGIFEEKAETNNVGMSMFSNSANTIITNVNVIKKMAANNEDLSISTAPTFVLTSSSVIELFEAELTEKGLSEYLAVQTNLDQVDGATSTISNVKTFAITFLIITLILGTIVLLVINMINIRERKYEIGVLRTIGMKKSKVCFQFLSELLIVSFVALILGASIGATLSVPVSNSLLKSEISSSQNEQENIRDNFGKGNQPDFGGKTGGKGNFNGVVQVQAFDSIDAVVDLKVLVELLALGLIITLISGSSAMISIQKFSPLTILKERS